MTCYTMKDSRELYKFASPREVRPFPPWVGQADKLLGILFMSVATDTTHNACNGVWNESTRAKPQQANRAQFGINGND